MKRRWIGMFLLIACVSGIPRGQALDEIREDQWRQLRETDGIRLYEQSVPGKELVALRGVGVLKAPVARILSVLRDVEHTIDWDKGVIKKYTIEDLSDLAAVTYNQVDLIWPFTDRDFVLHNELFYEKEAQLLVVKSYSVKRKEAGDQTCCIRGHISVAEMRIRPLSLFKTFVEMVVWIDPRGAIPAWVVNYYQKDVLFNYLKALEHRANTTSLPLRKGVKELLQQIYRQLKMAESY